MVLRLPVNILCMPRKGLAYDGNDSKNKAQLPRELCFVRSRHVSTNYEAPVRIELTNSRFAVCRLATWPRRRGSKLAGREPPEQAGHEDTKREAGGQNQDQHDERDRSHTE